MKRILIVVYMSVHLFSYNLLAAGEDTRPNTPDFLYPVKLFEQRDYHRTATEILRLRFSYPKESARRQLGIYLIKSYYRLGAYHRAEAEASQILKSSEKYSNHSYRKSAATLLTISLLKQGKDKQARTAWFEHVNTDLKSQPPLASEFPDRVDPNLAKLYSSFIPGSGMALSQQYGKAFVSFLINVIFIAGSYHSYQNQQYGIAGLLIFFEIGWYSGGKNASYESAELYNHRRIEEIRQKWIDVQKVDF